MGIEDVDLLFLKLPFTNGMAAALTGALFGLIWLALTVG